MTGDRELIERIALETSDVVTGAFADRGLCILATAVFVRTCAYFDIEARAVPVRATVFNPAATQWVADGGELDQGCLDAGGYLVRIDSESDRSMRYPGHLVAQVDDHRLLVDADFGQFSRPQHGMALPSAAAFDLTGLGWPESDFAAIINGSTAVYEHLPSAPDWRRAADWGDRKAKPLAGLTIRRVRDLLADRADPTSKQECLTRSPAI